MLGIFSSMKSAFLEYFADNWQGHIVLLVLAVVIIMVFAKEARIRSVTVYIPLLVLCLVILNPIVYKVIVSQYDYSYYRTFWLILLPFVAGIAGSLIIQKVDEHKRFMALIITILAIILTGPIVGMNHRMYPLKNVYRIDSQVIEVADIIMEDKCENKKAMVPEDMVWQIRQYADIKLLCGHNWWVYRDGIDTRAYNMVRGGEPFFIEYVINTLNSEQFPFVVLKLGTTSIEDMQEHGFENIGVTDDYEIYRIINFK